MAAYDHRADESVHVQQDVAPTAALVMDGVFLLRAELRELWDLTVYLDVPETVSIQRALHRDLELLGSPEELRRRYTRRYVPGQALYRQAARPLDLADVLVDNTDPRRPRVMRWHGARTRAGGRC